MRTRTLVVGVGAAGALTLTGIGVAVAEPTPSPAPSTSTPSATPEEDAAAAEDERRAAIEEALGGLVEDGTLTQDQAARVAETLADSPAVGPGWGWHHRWDGDGPPDWVDEADFDAVWSAAAEALGMSTEELQDALSEPGTSLADVAEQQGVDTQAVVDALVARAQARIDEAVAAGSLSEEQAAELRERLPDWVAAKVEGGWWSHRGGMDD
ncbi:hypothetical protein ACI8AC_24500 [Geodermatophilus sp. SYSU D00758]